MPRVHFVKKARKANKEAGIEKGDSYYWWKFRYGGKRVSKTRPQQSQLTQSGFLSAMYGLQEEYALLSADNLEDAESTAERLGEMASEVRELGEECSSKADNMECSFSGGSPTIDMLRERADACEMIADELESEQGELESAIQDKDVDSLSFGNVGWDFS